MTDLFLTLFHLPPLQYWAGVALLVLVGAILALPGRSRRGRLGRVGYFAILIVALLLIWLPSVALDATPVLLASGLFDAGVIAGIVSLLMAGALLYRASEARARDLGAPRSRAWLGLIPGFNLLLVLLPPRAPEEGTRPGLRRSAHPAAVAIGLAVLLLVYIADLALAGRRAAPDYYGPDRALYERIHLAGGMPHYMALSAGEYQHQLPYSIDRTTTLTAVHAQGATLTFDFAVQEEIIIDEARMSEDIRNTVCATGNYAGAVARGGVVAYRYSTTSGRQLFHTEVSSGDCAG
ncbi:hypothetical protein [Roseobacter sp. HKCCA0434]|uniref:hypothetical protein n=1 Tax=Roseobacter sp. HKCCA0434 TaxID=3079297 RepID=UPI0029059249|nr:hypothetical protein [Roseobacter sp. HKCCA0434]